MPQDRAYAPSTETDGNPRTKLIRVEINTSVITYNFMEKRRPLSVAVLELISNILGDTNNGLTGTEIHRFLLQAKIEDVLEKEQFVSKRVRLFKAFENFQNCYQCCNNILKCIQLILTPSRYVGRLEEFEELRTKINQQLAFEGYEINENGKFSNKKRRMLYQMWNLRSKISSKSLQNERLMLRYLSIVHLSCLRIIISMPYLKPKKDYSREFETCLV